MLLSDRDIRAELDAGRIGLEPLDATMVQPSSVDVRLDRGGDLVGDGSVEVEQDGVDDRRHGAILSHAGPMR